MESQHAFELAVDHLVMEVKTGKYEPADLGQLSGYMVMAKHVLNTPEDNPPVGMLVCKDHNRVLAKLHLEELGLPMGVTDYELKKVLPTQAQLAKCYVDAEAQFAAAQVKKGRRSEGLDQRTPLKEETRRLARAKRKGKN